MSVLFRPRNAALSALAVSACLLVFAAACADFGAAGPELESVTPAASPADALEYNDQDGRFSLRYPGDWYGVVGARGGSFWSFDPSLATGPAEAFPPNEVKVEASITEARGLSGCGGALNLDASGAVDSVDPQATETTLGGQPAWEIVRDNYEVGLTRIHAISLLREGYCLRLTAYFSQSPPDEETFQQIADSFEINF